MSICLLLDWRQQIYQHKLTMTRLSTKIPKVLAKIKTVLVVLTMLAMSYLFATFRTPMVILRIVDKIKINSNMDDGIS